MKIPTQETRLAVCLLAYGRGTVEDRGMVEAWSSCLMCYEYEVFRLAESPLLRVSLQLCIAPVLSLHPSPAFQLSERYSHASVSLFPSRLVL